MTHAHTATWRNWAGNVTARPARQAAPADVHELSALVRAAAEDGLKVKAVGTGHSFTAAAATDGLLIRPQRLTGIHHVDPPDRPERRCGTVGKSTAAQHTDAQHTDAQHTDAQHTDAQSAEGQNTAARTPAGTAEGTVTVGAGTPLKQLNAALARQGLSLTNMGDIMEQTVSGAVSTGTHGTGRDSGSLAAQLRGLELVTADGSVLSCSAQGTEEERAVFDSARIGLGALGVLSTLTFAVEPAFLLTAREEPMALDRVTARFDELCAQNEHFEFYWFPHTSNCITKRNNRSTGPAAPLGRIGGWFEDELLSNGVFQAVNTLGRAVPAAVPAIARVSSRALSARSYTDLAYRVFTSPRRVRFVEMEYALPREALVSALLELKAMIERSRLRISFPVEVRTAPADDVPLSTAYGRASAYIAVHMYRGTAHHAYFTAAERIFTAHGGRPHWGKMHTRDAGQLAAAYPRFGEFAALRDRLDPDRVFGNDYLRRILGD